MNAINQVIIEGNMVRKAESNTTPKGTKVCTFPVAVNRWYKDKSGIDQEEVSFFDVEAWEKLCENLERFGDKGRGLRIVGRLKQNRWKSPEGKMSSRVLIIAEHIEFKAAKPKNPDERNSMSAKEKAEAEELEKEALREGMAAVAREMSEGIEF